MFDKKSLLAIIPARGGSKRLPGKNIKTFAGKPLITRTIEAALSVPAIDVLMVSTDDKNIARIAKSGGAKVPLLRPHNLATDRAKSVDVIFHALDWYKKNEGKTFDLVLLLQPTSPLREAKDIKKALALFKKKKAGAVVSVCETEHHPWWSNILPPDHNMGEFLNPALQNRASQELPVFYRLNGAIYLANTAYLRKHNGFMGKQTYALIMDHSSSVDIDDLNDFKYAEFLKLKHNP
ncbi:MAG: acylneuraminate cytidylyltransferase family protein [bacterium]|nr:acylneuraminate cytidylyltransferase family protein [bacterium]